VQRSDGNGTELATAVSLNGHKPYIPHVEDTIWREFRR
jgi:hypothetical protein